LLAAAAIVTDLRLRCAVFARAIMTRPILLSVTLAFRAGAALLAATGRACFAGTRVRCRGVHIGLLLLVEMLVVMLPLLLPLMGCGHGCRTVATARAAAETRTLCTGFALAAGFGGGAVLSGRWTGATLAVATTAAAGAIATG
jgi:hypothetical protein